MEGLLTSNAVRVPTPNVSLAVLILELSQAVTSEAVNAQLKQASCHSTLQANMGYTEERDAASSDFVGDSHAGVVDGKATVCKGKKCNLYVWYDNEAGYSNQVIRIMARLAGATLPRFPPSPAY